MINERKPSKLIAALAAAIATFIISPSCSLCANTKLGEYPSPDGSLKVVVFERNCGATTAFSTQASVLPNTGDQTTGGGNVFVADSDHGKAPSGPGGGPELRVRWIDHRSVELSHHVRARIFKAESRVGAVRATFVTFQ